MHKPSLKLEDSQEMTNILVNTLIKVPVQDSIIDHFIFDFSTKLFSLKKEADINLVEDYFIRIEVADNITQPWLDWKPFLQALRDDVTETQSERWQRISKSADGLVAQTRTGRPKKQKAAKTVS